MAWRITPAPAIDMSRLHGPLSAVRRAYRKAWRLMVGTVVLIAFRVVALLVPSTLASRKPLWLIGGSNGLFYDGNAAALHKYVREKHPEIDIVFVIKRESPHFQIAAQVGPVVAHSSISAFWLSLKADVLVSTHSRRSDIADYARRHCNSALAVHLFHGVTGLKRKAVGSGSVFGEYDLLIATGTREKDIKVALGCPVERVAITGFPQHDYLPIDRGQPGRKQILFLPTWRSWLAPSRSHPLGENLKRVEESYFEPILSVLRHEELADYCLRSHIKIRVMLHRNMQFLWLDFLRKNKHQLGEYVDFLPPETSIQQEIVAASLLVTDYSSVAWEFLYMKRPVVFYTFDLEEYMAKQGTYLSIPDELFGPCVVSPNDAVEAILVGLREPDTVSRSERASEIRRQFFAYEDSLNNYRVVAEIQKRLRHRDCHRASVAGD